MLKSVSTAALLLAILCTGCECDVLVGDNLVGQLNNQIKGNSNSNINKNKNTARSSLLDNGLSRTLGHLYTQCADSEDFFWCTKVQATKLLGRALKVQNINIIDGLTIVRKNAHNHNNETATLMRSGGGSGLDDVTAETAINLSNRDIEQLSMKSLDALLHERFQRFLQSRQIQISVPRMLAFGQRNSQNLLQDIFNYLTSWISGGSGRGLMADFSEGRGKKKDDKKYLGPFIATVMMKAAILKMAYHSIAIIAGKALIVGKIALIISAIIGLKKLVSSEGGEKTTYEIVKHPQVQQSHTYSSSHSGEYEGGHESGGSGGAYHRSIDDEMMMQDKAYQAWIPTAKIS